MYIDKEYRQTIKETAVDSPKKEVISLDEYLNI